MSNYSEIIQRVAKQEFGFLLAGIIPVQPAKTFPQFKQWLEADYHGTMDWLWSEGRQDKRATIQAVMPQAKTVIMLAEPYFTVNLPRDILQDPSRGIFARYTWGRDYHKVLKTKCESVVERLHEVIDQPFSAKVYIDTGPILERDYAQVAGLGFVGKNSMLIHPRFGSYFFLCEIVLDLATDPLTEQGNKGGCRNCQKCLKRCPTGAIVAPGVINAPKCISYLTIEYRDAIPLDIQPLMKNRIYGCDICQEVCPWNGTANAKTWRSTWLKNEINRQAPLLADLAKLTEADFMQRYAGTPVMRTKYRGLLRNVAIALGNWKQTDTTGEAEELLQYLAHHQEALVHQQAQILLAATTH